jgi:DNA-binding FadR family transcriptional regulator
MPKASAIAAATVRRRIVRGELKENDALPTESELIKRFGISRPTLREMLRILEAEGLIEVRRGARGGARVRAPSPEGAVDYVGLLLEFQHTSVADVLKTHAILEAGAARELAERPHPSLLPLEELLQLEERALGDAEQFNDVASTFHAQLIELSGGQTLMLMGQMLSRIAVKHGVVVASVQQKASTGVPAWQTRSHEIHAAVVELIRTKNAKRVADLWAAHCRANQKATFAGNDSVLDLFN